ncbi:DUF3245 domain-containing protein [Aspergillus stella-maris]|uniref:DUF3245 domain-containing protein n=1 Tax=Aspergillus stella-maris TaxID=1810926 RepID=UPI003CCE127F
MTKMSLSKSETDIILNKANIALARSQRLVASWLPAEPSTESSGTNTKTDAEVQREEDEIFTAVPETLGLGAPLPSKAADGSWNRTELDSNDALRRQLLGRNYKKVMAEKERARKEKAASIGSENGTTGKGAGSTGQQKGNGAMEEDDDDEDEGRAASIGKKAASRKRKGGSGGETTPAGQKEDPNGGESKDEAGEEGDESKTVTSQQRSRTKGRKKATSFLDEILAERSKKRAKR